MDVKQAIEDATQIVTAATDKIVRLEARLKKATELLREWRDKYGGQAVHRFGATYPGGPVLSVSPSDLLRDTQKFLEGK